MTQPHEADIVCTDCGAVNKAGAKFCVRCGTFLEWQTRTQSVPSGPSAVPPSAGRPSRSTPTGSRDDGHALIAHMSTHTLVGEAGSTVDLTISLHNRGSTVDQLSVVVLGPAEAWADIEPAFVNLLPDARATVTIAFRLPRREDVEQTTVDFGVGIRSREHPEQSVLKRGEIQVEAFTDFTATMRPSVLRARAEATTTVELTNRGTTAVSASLQAEDAEDALQLSFSPGQLHVSPRTSGQATLHVRPRVVRRGGQPETHRFSVTVSTPDGRQEQLDGTYITVPEPAPATPTPPPAPTPAPPVVQQVPYPRRRGPWGCLIGLLVGLVVAVAVVGGIAWAVCQSNDQCRSACLDDGFDSPGCNLCDLVGEPFCS